MNLLSYDYHSSFEPEVNHHAPLRSLENSEEYEFDEELNIVSQTTDIISITLSFEIIMKPRVIGLFDANLFCNTGTNECYYRTLPSNCIC